MFAEIVAVGSRTLSKAEAFVEETGLKGQAKAYGRWTRSPCTLIKFHKALLDERNLPSIIYSAHFQGAH